VFENTPPTAVVGEDQTVTERSRVELDGSASYDYDLDPITYAWTQTSGPEVYLSDANTSNPSFTAPEVDSSTTLQFSLVVNDGVDDSIPDTVNVMVEPDDPDMQAVLNCPETAYVATATLIDGSDSFDPDGHIVYYNFDFGDGSSTGNVNTSQVTHNYGSLGNKTVTLEVTDSDGNRDSTSCTIEVIQSNSTFNELETWMNSNNSQSTAENIGTATWINATLYWDDWYSEDEDWFMFVRTEPFSLDARLKNRAGTACPVASVESPCSNPSPIGTLELRNGNGNLIASDEYGESGWNCPVLNEEEAADLANLPAGTYYLKLRGDDIGWGYDCDGSALYSIDLTFGTPQE
jgi:hypothetical protein